MRVAVQHVQVENQALVFGEEVEYLQDVVDAHFAENTGRLSGVRAGFQRFGREVFFPEFLQTNVDRDTPAPEQEGFFFTPALINIVENKNQCLLHEVLNVGVRPFVAFADRKKEGRQQIDHLPLRLPVEISAGFQDLIEIGSHLKFLFDPEITADGVRVVEVIGCCPGNAAADKCAVVGCYRNRNIRAGSV